MQLDVDIPLREPIRLGRRYPERIAPFTTVRQLIDFAQAQAETGGDFADLWQRVYEDLLQAVAGGVAGDLAFAVARFKMAAHDQEWLGG